MIYKKTYLGGDPTKHPAYKEGQSLSQISSDEGSYGIYYLSKFRGLHNHPLDFNGIYAQIVEPMSLNINQVKKFNDEKEL